MWNSKLVLPQLPVILLISTGALVGKRRMEKREDHRFHFWSAMHFWHGLGHKRNAGEVRGSNPSHHCYHFHTITFIGNRMEKWEVWIHHTITFTLWLLASKSNCFSKGKWWVWIATLKGCQPLLAHKRRCRYWFVLILINTYEILAKCWLWIFE